MKRKKYLAVLLLSTVLFASCEQEGTSAPKSQNLSITASVVDQMTRSVKNEFISGDQIGLFLVNPEGNNYNNCNCSFNNKATFSTEWALQDDILLTDELGTLYSYYPYSDEVRDMKQIPLSSSSQHDYLVSRPAKVDVTNTEATLRMQHVMSLVKFSIKKDGYLGNGHITKIVLKGIGLSGTMDATNGNITTLTNGNEIYDCNLSLDPESPLTVGIIAFPQSVSSTTALITIDGEQYGYKLVPSNWEQGKETTYTLGIDVQGHSLFTIGTSSIDNWGEGGSYEGNLSSGGIDVGTEI